jgi:tRNA-2-methylthio-N6-dimethylallyladenosine synthase
MTRRYYLWNIGCQMNRADGYRVQEGLEAMGYRPTPRPHDAQVLVLNTCVVRQSAEDKVSGRLSSLAPLMADGQPRTLLVMGCIVDGDREGLRARFPHVDAFFQPSDVSGVVGHVRAWEAEALRRAPGEGRLVTPPQVADLVPISYGCDHHCTYCIVTIRRGAQRSRPVPEIVADVERLVAGGAREITLLGQNVDAYGTDVPGGPDLADVLSAVHEVEGLWRIRFLTSHPREMTQRIIDRVAALPRVCPSWELAVQSGDDEVLHRMGRGYTVARFEEIVARIRAATPECGINTDVIVGFPGETAAQFEHTMDLLRRVRFDQVHVASYSVRPGTPAALLEDDVPAEEKERRRREVEALQEGIAGEIAARHLGQEVEILVDGRQKGRWRGRTRTGRLVFFESADDWLGRLVTVRVTWAGPWSMIGEVASEDRG